MDPKGKVAVVTGGASGLGEATVRLLAEAGAKIAIFDMNEERGTALATAIGGDVSFFACNIMETETVEKAIEAAMAKFGRIDILVNCAGTGWAEKTATKRGPHSLDTFRNIINLNVIGVFDVVRNAAAKMIANDPDADGGRGVIVNVSSVAAFDGQVGQVAYAASKAAVVGMTLPIARDLSTVGIRICTICPGTFDTPLLAMVSDEVKAGLAASVPFPKRLGNPKEFALLADQIIRNNFLNGETIRLDGAIRMPIK